MANPKWDIRNEGRAWSGEEGFERYHLKPHKIEVIKGKLLWSNKDCEILLGLLLENVGLTALCNSGVRRSGGARWPSCLASL